MTGEDFHREPEGSRLKIELDLTGIESAFPKTSINIGMETPVAEGGLLEPLATRSLAALAALVRENIEDRDSHSDYVDYARSRIRAEKRSVNEHGPTGTTRGYTRKHRRGRGRLF